MTKVPLCLVGCGGMGLRHIQGYAALQRSGLSNIELVAVCDIRADNANRAADEAGRVLGRRPEVYIAPESAMAAHDGLAFDVVTEAWTHPGVVKPLLAAGSSVLCEKPLALTMRACRELIDAARQSGALLATAENYRRDPVNRLVRAVLDAGLLGHVHLMQQFLAGGDDRIIISPWRHMKERGTIALDMACHFTDLIEYYLGRIEAVTGYGFIAEPVRHRRERPEQDSPAYWARLREMPETLTATGEDSLVALYETRSGALAQVTYIPSGPGRIDYRRTIHGRLGSLEIPKDRTGAAVTLYREGGAVSGNNLAALIGGVALDEVTARLFDNQVRYDRPFAETDSNLLAIEVHDFARAILTGSAPEIDADMGADAVVAVQGVMESMRLGRRVTMDELRSLAVSAYQDEIDRALGADV